MESNEGKPNHQTESSKNEASEDEQQSCPICLIDFADLKSDVRVFGILDGCSHVFCWTCIDSWRKTWNQNMCMACPVCRTRTRYLYRSDKLISKEDDKESMFADQRRKQEEEEELSSAQFLSSGYVIDRYGVRHVIYDENNIDFSDDDYFVLQ